MFVTIPFTILTAVVGALYTDVSEFISLLGGFCVVIIAFFFPMFLYVKGNNRKFSDPKNIITIIICIIVCSIGFTSAGLSVWTMVSSIWKK